MQFSPESSCLNRYKQRENPQPRLLHTGLLQDYLTYILYRRGIRKVVSDDDDDNNDDDFDHDSYGDEDTDDDDGNDGLIMRMDMTI